MFSFIGWIIIGGLAGWLASMAMGTNREQGCITDVILGIVGAVVGGFVLSLFNVGGGASYQGFNIFSLISATLGAVIVLFIWKRVAS